MEFPDSLYVACITFRRMNPKHFSGNIHTFFPNKLTEKDRYYAGIVHFLWTVFGAEYEIVRKSTLALLNLLNKVVT